MRQLAAIILFISYIPLFFIGNKELTHLLSNIYSIGTSLGVAILFLYLYLKDNKSYLLASSILFFVISASVFLDKVFTIDFSSYYPASITFGTTILFIITLYTIKWKQKKSQLKK